MDKRLMFYDCVNCLRYVDCSEADNIRPMDCDMFCLDNSLMLDDDFSDWDLDNPESFV